MRCGMRLSWSHPRRGSPQLRKRSRDSLCLSYLKACLKASPLSRRRSHCRSHQLSGCPNLRKEFDRCGNFNRCSRPRGSGRSSSNWRSARFEAPLTTSAIEQVKRLITQGRITEARNLLVSSLRHDPTDAQLREWLKLVEPPRINAREVTDEDRTVDFNWIRENRDEYRGMWVAVLDGQLLFHAKTLGKLRETLPRIGTEKSPLIHFVE